MKVVTVTLNPAVDLTLQAESLRVGEINSVLAMRKDSGGKGINVAKALQNLGISAVATGFIGGSTGEWLQGDLKRRGVAHAFIPIQGETRTNIKIISPEGETQLNGLGPIWRDVELQLLVEQIDRLLEKGDGLVLAGSVPREEDPAVYRQIVQALRERSPHKRIFIAIDTSGEALKESLAAQPDFLKPNEEELGQLVGKEGLREEEMVREAKHLVRQGIAHVLVSRGAEGSIYVSAEGAYRVVPPLVKVRSTVGSGDATVAGFVGHLLSNGDALKAFLFANACGTATAMKEGSQVCRREEAEQILSQLSCKPIEG